MSARRRKEIHMETHERRVIRYRIIRSSARCDRCQQSVPAFTLEECAALLEMNLDDITRCLQADSFHFVADRREPRLLCGNSLGNGSTVA